MSPQPTTTHIDCPACQLYGPPVTPREAAEKLAATHDQMLHGGHPTAFLHSEPHTPRAA
jgi:hypothetical protein